MVAMAEDVRRRAQHASEAYARDTSPCLNMWTPMRGGERDMAAPAAVPGFRRHGLYYPYFHVRDERWIKVAALYWPRIVRIVPSQYRTWDSSTVRALAGDFIVSQPPGQSVEAIAPRFAELISNHANDLRARFSATSPPGYVVMGRRATLGPGPEWAFTAAELARPERLPKDPLDEWDDRHGRWLTGVHVSEMTAELRDIFIRSGLALPGESSFRMSPIPNSIDGETINRRRWFQRLPERELHDWLLMHPALVGVYTSVLAEDFAAANMLQPTTDQDSAYAVTNNWTADRIAAALLYNPGPSATVAPDEIPEILGFLALGLVVPADLDTMPVEQIIDIRERYSAEFFAFGQAVDEAAAAIAELPAIRDQSMLEDYLHQVVTVRFAQPLEDLHKKIRQLTGDAVTMSINVKTQLPAGAALAGGAWLSGHPLLAGTSAVAVGLMAVRRGIRQRRDDALKSAPAASYLLHTQTQLQPRSLLDRTFRQIGRITGA
jgi:hypothetical protein